ncbi:MAG TPA: efflux RND transporter periplasmic adaptor subunit [Polyangiaceae bacterium]|nr:efflux RND transporter periplasmic adaptor subunit [Polyangiaceae bacterium]
MNTRAIVVLLGCSAVAAAGASIVVIRHMEGRTNKQALVDHPARVAFVRAREVTYRPSRTYVGTLRPWVEANVGPQLVSAYVDTVLVRPGAVVRRGDVLATLDCRPTNTEQATVAMQARALAARQKAVADEADRTRRLLDGGFASANEVEQALAQSAVETAQLAAQQAMIAHGSLQISDCVLRAPFDGEVGDRYADPGSYVHPGAAVVSIVDRGTVRFVADAPEGDFGVVAPRTPVRLHLDATGQDTTGAVSRRAPHADREVRTVHFEVDIPNPDRVIPVDTTAEVRIEVGAATVATAIPIHAATVQGSRATLFVVEEDRARLHVIKVLDESSGDLLLEHALLPHTPVITEGRALLHDGDRVDASDEQDQAKWASDVPTAVAHP